MVNPFQITPPTAYFCMQEVCTELSGLINTWLWGAVATQLCDKKIILKKKKKRKKTSGLKQLSQILISIY